MNILLTGAPLTCLCSLVTSVFSDPPKGLVENTELNDAAAKGQGHRRYLALRCRHQNGALAKHR